MYCFPKEHLGNRLILHLSADVILSAAKNLFPEGQILRFAQNDSDRYFFFDFAINA